MKKTHVIIGASAAGIGVLNTLRNFAPDDEIICISQELARPYNKCFLADYVGQIKEESQLFFKEPAFFEKNKISYITGMRVERIDSNARQVYGCDGQKISYDTLFLGTGSSPAMPNIEGISTFQGVFTFHTHADAQALIAYIKNRGAKSAVIIGAGLSGLECADALCSYGIRPTIIDIKPLLLSSFLDERGSLHIEQQLVSRGISFLKESVVDEIIGASGVVTGVRVGSAIIKTDMVIVATGLRSNVFLAQQAGLNVDQGAVVTNQFLQTSDPLIYAGGDCALVTNKLTGNRVRSCMWPDALQQGMMAAYAMAGAPKPYPGVAIVTSSSFFGTQFVCGGVFDGFEPVIDTGSDYYHKVTVDAGQLKGFLLVGQVNKFPVYRRALLTGETVNFLSLKNNAVGT
jgi:NAD(P)H-nitrite reductase large subunit